MLGDLRQCEGVAAGTYNVSKLNLCAILYSKRKCIYICIYIYIYI